MNKKETKDKLKELVSESTDSDQLMFRYTYGNGDVSSDINTIIESMDNDIVGWAIASIEQNIEERGKKVVKIVNEIVDKLGTNHTKTIGFDKVNDNTKVYALYTYRGEVYVLREGMDIPFEDVGYDEQQEIIAYIKEGSYTVDNTIQ